MESEDSERGIDKIIFDILEESYIRGKNGIVSSNVKQKGEVENLSHEFYNITLMINNKVYIIDPILQFHEE